MKVVIIPALNEEKTIGLVISNALNYVDEVIVVDDGSSDRTKIIAEKNATVISHCMNKGYDFSLNNGFKEAVKKGADIIITMDADGQHFAEDIPKIIAIINDGADIVVGLRPYRARFMESVFASYGKRKGILDPLCGFKVYKTSVYKDIGFFDNINSIGTQLTFVAQKKGYKISNFKIKLKKRKDVPRFGRLFVANVKLFFAFLKLVTYLYKMDSTNK